MSDHGVSEAFVKTGDLVTFFSEEREEDGYLSCITSAGSGADPSQVVVTPDLDKDCVIKIVPMVQYKEGLEQKAIVGPVDELQTQLEGKDLIYGQIIQLFHPRTQRFLSSRDELTAAAVTAAGSGFVMQWTKDGSRSCWFKILPHTLSNRQIGERVRESDKVRVEHVLTGCGLHQSEALNQRQQFIVEMRFVGDPSSPTAALDNVTPWVIAHSTLTGAHRATLKHGSYVRLQDIQAGFLRAPPGVYAPIPGQRSVDLSKVGPVKAKNYGVQGNELVCSYHTIFEVQDEAAVRTAVSSEDDIPWTKPLRLRLFGTDFYLTATLRDEPSFSPAESVLITDAESLFSPQVASDAYSLSLTDDLNDPNTIFTFHPLKKESEEIQFGVGVMIQSFVLKLWIHCSDDFAYATGKKGAQESDVECTRQFNYKDAFSLRSVPRYQIDDFNFLMQTRLPTLLAYAKSIQSGNRVDKKKRIEVGDILSDLIRFVTVSDQMDPFKREGAPNYAHQVLLGRPDVLAAIFSVAYLGEKSDAKITQLSYILLRHIVRDHPKNGANLHKIFKLPVFDDTFDLEKVEYYRTVPVSSVMIEMYKANPDLTYGLKPAAVKEIIAILKVTQDAQYLDVLSHWCRFKGQVVYNNQRIIAELLHANVDEGLVIRSRHKGTAVQVKSSRDWVDILEFTAPRKFAEDEVSYHLKMLRLFSDLCVGRNQTSIKVVTSAEIGMTYEEAFWCVRNKLLDPAFRAAYSDVLLNVFVDTFPQNPTRTAFRKIWFSAMDKTEPGGPLTGSQKLPQSMTKLTRSKTVRGQKSPLAAGEASKNLVEAATQLASISFAIEEDSSTFVTKYENPNSLQEFLIDYLYDVKAFRFDLRQQQSKQPHFLARVLALMRKSFEFEVFKRKEHHLLPQLKAILEICEDRDHTGAKRVLESEEVREQLLSIKMQVVKMINRYFDLQQTALVSKFMATFAKETLSRRDLSEDEMKDELGSILIHLFSGTPEAPQISTDAEITRQLVPALLAQLHHNDPALTAASLSCLTRVMLFQSKAATLIKTLTKIQILTNQNDVDFYHHANTEIEKIRGIAASPITTKSLPLLLSALDSLTSFLNDSRDPAEQRRVRQDIFRNISYHELVLSIAQLPLDIDASVGEQGRMSILKSCYEFLRFFAANNKANQKTLFDSLSFMISQVQLYASDPEVPRAITLCLIEVLRQDPHLRLRLLDKHLRPFVTLAFDNRKEPVYFELLAAIIGDRAPLKELQNMILRILVAHPDVKTLLHDEIKQLRKAQSRLEKEEELEPKGRKRSGTSGQRKEGGTKEDALKGKDDKKGRKDRASLIYGTKDSAFVASLISLLALTSKGRNYFTERSCQKLVPLDDIIAACYALKDRAPALLRAYAFFADEVYLNVDATANEALPSVVQLQHRRFFWSFLASLSEKLVVLGEVASSGAIDEDQQNLILVALPFIQHFFSLAFLMGDATSEDILIAQRLLDAIYLFRGASKSDPRMTAAASAALRSLHSAGIRGAEYAKKIDKLAKSAVTNVALSEVDTFHAIRFDLADRHLPLLKGFLDGFLGRIYRALAVQFFMEDCKVDAWRTEPGAPDLQLQEMAADDLSRDYTRLLMNVFDAPKPKLHLIALRIIKQYLDYDGNLARNTLVPFCLRQAKLATLDAPVAFLALLKDPNPRLVRLALGVLVSMLQGRAASPHDQSRTATSVPTPGSVLARFFTSQSGVSFFADVANMLADGRHFIKEFRRRVALTAATFYHAHPFRDPKLGPVVELPAAPDIGLTVQEIEESVAMPPDMLIHDVSQFLELSCQNSDSSIVKTILITHSGDLVRDFGHYLKVFERSICKENISVAVRIFQFLAAAVRDNPANQLSAVQAQTLITANRMLLATFVKPHEEGVDPELSGRIVELKTAVINFLLALTETGDSQMSQAVLTQVSPKGFEITTSPLAAETAAIVPPTTEAVALGSRAFRLIKLLVSNDASHTKTYLESLAVCERHTQALIGRVEVLNAQDKIETLYFPIPSDFRKQAKMSRRFFQSWSNLVSFHRDTDVEALNKAREERLNKSLTTSLEASEINWSRAGDRIDKFATWTEHTLLRRELNSLSQSVWIGRLFVKLWPLFWNLSFLVALLINGFLLFSSGLRQFTLEFPTRILGYVELGLAVFVLISYSLRSLPYSNAKRWLAKLDQKDSYALMSWSRLKKEFLAPHYRHSEALYVLISIWHAFSEPSSLFYIMYLGFAVLGVGMSPLFFSFHIFQILFRADALKFIMRALARNIKTMFFVFMVFFQVMYVNGIILWVFFQDHFTPLWPAENCHTIMQCFLTTFYFDLKGTLSQFATPFFVDPWDGGVNSTEQSYVWVIFIYWFIATVVGSSIFAAIVDTFGGLREAADEAKDALATSCFICSLTRDRFQEKNRDFVEHQEKEHNRLHYFYFFAYLRDRMSERGDDRVALTPQEQRICLLIQSRTFLKMFPVNRALVLEGESEGEELNDKLLSHNRETSSGITIVETEIKTLQKEMADIWLYFGGRSALASKSAAAAKRQ